LTPLMFESPMYKRVPSLHALALPALLILMILASCVPQKKIRYFQDKSDNDTTETVFKNPRSEDYKIQVADNLFVRLMSVDDKSSAFDQMADATNVYQEEGIYLNSYGVDKEGFIEFPLIGKVKVENMTIQEIRDSLQVRVNEYVRNTTVIVKLTSFRVTMLGEFNRPGKYLVYQDKITIFEAIGMAGDLTDFARRHNALLVRMTDNGYHSYRLDLNDQAIVESDFFYLQPNDLLYVEPVRAKAFAFNNFPYVLVFTAITTGLLLMNYIQ
jgi:polysaccharide biosynthesis/export protein